MVFLFAIELKHINEPHCFFIYIIIVTIIMPQTLTRAPNVFYSTLKNSPNKALFILARAQQFCEYNSLIFPNFISYKLQCFGV